MVIAPDEPQPTQVPGPLRVPVWLAAVVFWAVTLLLVAAHTMHYAPPGIFGMVAVVFTSIVTEALPFILIGAVVSAVIGVYVPERSFAALARMPRWIQIPGAAAAGVAFPVCECGSVPVARRLIARGIDPAAGVAFMLAAPIVNPVVLGTTWLAYSASGRAVEMTAARGGLGLLVAVTSGVLIARFTDSSRVLRGDPSHGDCGAACAHDHHGHVATVSRHGRFAQQIAAEFSFMGKFLLLGAAVSATIQALLPQSLVSSVGGTEIVAVATMVVLAFALALCSEADAFVAVSFTSFPISAQLAFLVVGPVLDAKLAFLYGATFRRSFLPLLAATAIPITIVGALVFGVLA
jgi:uncharacterized membrane protein YraQ (UPF0718 family)